jgi:hypothetical protein
MRGLISAIALHFFIAFEQVGDCLSALMNPACICVLVVRSRSAAFEF